MTDLDEKVVTPVLLTTGMVVGVKTIERVAGYKRRRKGGKCKTVRVRSYKRRRKRGKKKSKK